MTTQLKAVYYTYPIILEEEKPENVKKYIGKLHNRLEELEKQLSGPYQQAWKEKYLELEKKTDERWKELDQTILRLKEKLREKDREKNEWEQKYRGLKNDSKNVSDYQTQVLQLADKHLKFMSIQRIFSPQEVQERKFLKLIYDKVWKLV